MNFSEMRRQQFLGESPYHAQIAMWDEVIAGQQENLLKPEGGDRGWHCSVRQGLAQALSIKLFLRYTAGEPIGALRADLEKVIAAYERYGIALWDYAKDRNEPVFKFYSIDDYCELMQLIGLCFLLHRRDLLPRLARLQDGENRANGGADWIVEELLSYAPMQRHETEHLCAAKPYEALSDALSSDDNDAGLRDLDRFLKHWYKDLAGCGWHDSHKPNEAGEQGGYFGYWSFEAGAAVLLLGIEDDSSLHKYLYYPKDLVAWSRAHASLSAEDGKTESRLRCLAGEPCPREGWWFTPANTNSRRRFTVGELMPEFGGDYGATIWQWDEQQ